MQLSKIHNKGQAKLFRSPYLEWLTKTHPLITWSMYLPAIVFLIYYSSVIFRMSGLKISLLLFSGVLFWTFFEYLMHRYIFHFIAKSKKSERFLYIVHGNHHEYPRDRQRLFMPPVPSILFSASIFFTMNLLGFLIAANNYAFPFFAGFLFGYLLYGSMHYAIHAGSPPFKWMKPLWRNHHLHHYKEQEKGFGVSSTFWDRVFGTMFDLEKEKEEKDKVKDLMFEPGPSKKTAS